MISPSVATDEEFLAVPVSTIRVDETVPFPVYAQIHGTPVIYRKEGECFSDSHLKQVAGMQLKNLLTPVECLDAYLKYLYGAFQEILDDDNKRPNAKMGACYESGVQATKQALIDPESVSAFDAIRQFVRVSLLLMEQHEFTYTGLRSVMDHNPELSGHSVNVCLYGMLLGRIAGYQPLLELGLALLLHDVGMVALPPELLEKKEFDDEDWQQIREHPALGIKRTSCASRLSTVARDVIQNHHERLDGSGYPRGLTGGQLTVPSRIASIVNTFDSRTTNRHYRPATPTINVVRQMWQNKGWYDEELLKAFLRSLTT